MARPGPDRSHDDSRARAEHALKLRALGRTWTEIADTLGYRSRGAAATAVKNLLDKRGPVDTAEERATSTEMLRVLKSTMSARLVAAVQRGDDDMALRFSKELRGIDAQHSKLNGTFAPEVVQHDVRVSQTPEAILERAQAELLAAMRDQPALETIDAEVVK